MKLLTWLLCTIFIHLTFASPTSNLQSSASLTENLSQTLYIHLNPILQNTFQQLKKLVENISQSRSEWNSDLFDGKDSITSQWENHINDFFTHIPTVYENDDRSLFDTVSIKTKLRPAVKNLVTKLENLCNRATNQLKSKGLKQTEILQFQQQVSRIFDNTTEQLNEKIDQLIDSIFRYLDSLKGRVVG